MRSLSSLNPRFLRGEWGPTSPAWEAVACALLMLAVAVLVAVAFADAAAPPLSTFNGGTL